MSQKPFPFFSPNPLLRNGHVQTLVSHLYEGPITPYRAKQHEIKLDDGDALVLHDDCPETWQRGGRTCLIVHGLSGSHRSAYVVRTAEKLNRRGVRTFCLDLRGCGAGQGKAKQIYHAGRTEDLQAALLRIADLCPGSTIALVGFSLGGLMATRLAAEAEQKRWLPIDRLVAVCPPLNLMACQQLLRRTLNALYDWYFARRLVRQVTQSPLWQFDELDWQVIRKLRRLRDFDEHYTARVAGFGTARNYYRQATVVHELPKIRVPTLFIATEDDPVIPAEQFRNISLSETTRLVLCRNGGHMGFWGGAKGDPDPRWMDWRVVEWVCGDYDEHFSLGDWAKSIPASALPNRLSGQHSESPILQSN